MQDIIGGVSLGKKIIGIFLYHWNFECGSLTWQCGRYLGRSFFLFLLDCWGAPFFHFLFPLWFLGTPCIPALFSTAPSLTPSLLPLPDLYVCVHVPEVRPSSLLTQQLGLYRSLQGATSLSQRWEGGGWGPAGRKGSGALLFGTCGQSSLGPDTQTVWEEVMEKVQTFLYQGLYFRSKFIDI